ncbi:hypothetical protein [Mycobacterium sp. 236(2023)]|uniref:hypothetical protein n=1 Tax=Mycobacterium sp. 236(2023) TaxID=3038163 RepID=UPI0024153A4B|nr:hypothetical protein [Mycobacterium sp. 236(2023)]MDG4667891.1 hypothetical protein [Mycobacterium sp. 236(2023)]
MNDMFETVSSNALIQNANDATDVALATRSGETAHAFANYWANNWDTLKDIDGNSGIGQVNSHLTRSMAHMLDPYIGDMVGRSTNLTAGFEALDSQAELAKFNNQHTRQLFALMNTDDEAAQFFNTEAMKDMLFLQDRATDSLARDPSGACYSDMQAMGQLQGVIDAANEVEFTERRTDGNADAQNAFDRRNKWIDWISQDAGHLPVVGSYTGDATFLLRRLFEPPVPQSTTQAPAPADMNYAHYYMVDNFARQQLGDLSKIDIFRPGGEFMSYDQALNDVGASGITDNVGQYIDSINKTGRDADKYGRARS